MRNIFAIVSVIVLFSAAFAAELIRRNIAWTLEGKNNPIVQITNESDETKSFALRILIEDSVYRYPADLQVPAGENDFLEIRKMLDKISERHPEVRNAVSGLLQVEYEGTDREVKTRIVNLNPKGITSERESDNIAAPVIQEIDPTSGSLKGGTTVRIIGENFDDSATVKFGGVPALRTRQSSEVLVAVTPAHKAGGVDVEVSNGRRTARLKNAFEYVLEGPFVMSVDPESGPARGGTRVMIRGRNFEPDAVILWDGKPVSAQVRSAEQITLSTPRGESGPITLEVVNPGNKSFRLNDAYLYRGAPQVTSVNPETGTRNGGYMVTVNGNNFEEGASILMNGRYVQTTFINPRAVAGLVPAGESGVVGISVSNPDGEVDTLEGAFLYNDPPQILSIHAFPNPIVRLTQSTIRVEAIDPEAEALDYEYRLASSPGGSLSPHGEEATYHSSNSTGTAVIQITVTDIHRSKTQGVIEIQIE